MINQFLRAGGARNLQEFYSKFPTEEHFNHYMKYGGGLNTFAPGGPILPGTMSTAIADYQQGQAQPVAGANGLPDYLRRPQDQMESFVGPTAPAGWPTAGPIPSNEPKYTGVSIVDMLGGKGKATDFGSRKKFAENIGITGYTGTPDQNAQFIDIINNNPGLIDQYTSATSGAGRSSSGGGGGKKKVSDKKTSDGKSTGSGSGNSWMLPAGIAGAGVIGYGAYKATKAELDALKGVGNLYKGKSAADIAKLIKNRGFRQAGDYEQLVKAGMKPAEAMSSLKGMKFAEGAAKDVIAAAQQGKVYQQTENAMKNALPIAENYANRFKNAKPIIKQIQSAGVRSAEDIAALRKAGLTSKEAMEAVKGIPMAKVADVAKAGKWGDMFKTAVAAAKEVPWIKGAYKFLKSREYGGPSHQNDTYSAGVSYGAGGTFIPTYGEAALPVYNYGNQAMYGAGYAYGGSAPDGRALVNAYAYGGPTYSKITQYPHQQYVPAFDWMQDGGMSPEQADQMQEGQPQDQMQDQQQAQQQPPSQDQIMQEVAQMLQQGVPPEQIMQQLAQMGIPQDQAQQMIQMVMQQMQGGQGQAPQGQPEQAPQPGMAYGGKFEVGGEYEMNKNDVQRLLNQGYKIEYL